VNANTAAVLGLVIGLFGVLAGLAATIIVQQREDARARRTERWRQATAKQERLRMEFEKVLRAAYSFEAMTSPFVWVNPSTLPEGDYKTRLITFVENAYEGLKNADVRLRLEGATEVVDAVDYLTRAFGDFQSDLASPDRHSNANIKDLWDRAEKIKALVTPLDKILRHQLDALTPPESDPVRSGPRGWFKR
jgi:hypothetical protein